MTSGPALVVDYSRAEVASGTQGSSDVAYGPSIDDHDIARQRALQSARGRRLFPSLHAATLACSRLRLPAAAHRTGIVVATSVTDRHVAGHFPEAFLTNPHEASQHSRRLDVLVAVSRFVSGGLLQDIASMLGIDGPELCLPGDCGIAPLALARLFIDAGRADAMIVVAVEPRTDDTDCHEAVAVVAARTTTSKPAQPLPSVSEIATDVTACVPAILEYVSRAPAAHHAKVMAHETHCAVSWARQATASDPHDWLYRSCQLLDECARVAATTELGVVSASFLDLSPDHALHAIERGATPSDVARAAGEASFGCELKHHAVRRGLRGPCLHVAGIPGASLLALAIAEDLIKQAVVPAVAVIAGDWVGEGAARALGVLACPDRPHLRTSTSAVLLQRAGDRPDAPRMRGFVARREVCDRFSTDFRSHAPSHANASGCTSNDMEAAERFIARSYAQTNDAPQPPVRRGARFLGADALACLAGLLERPGRSALSVRNDLGGSGVVFLDPAG